MRIWNSIFQADVTPSVDWQGSSVHKTFKARRWGHMVELSMHLLRTSNIGVNTPLATLPEQFRPAEEKELSAIALTAASSHVPAHVIVEPDGSVRVSASEPNVRWITSTVSYLL